MLGLPEATELKKVIPKKVFYSKFALNAAEQREFDAAIRQMAIVNEISQRTIPALSSKAGDKAIYVLAVQLKQESCDEKLVQKLVNLIDQRIILALCYEDKVQLAVFCEQLFMDEIAPAAEKKLQLKGMALNSLWSNLVLDISRLDPKDGETIEETIERTSRLRALEKERAALEKKMWAEKQAKKKLELRMKINELKCLIEALK